MSTTLDVVALIGSLRRDSWTRRLVAQCQSLAPSGVRIQIVEIGGLPLYNADFEDSPPEEWRTFRERIRVADAVLFATPEYNRSVPACLKNAIDVGSRPYGQSVWAGKPTAILSTSPGAMGAFGANHHLRQSLVFLDMPTLQQPEAYLGAVDRLFDAEGHITNLSTRDFLARFLAVFEAWIRRQRLATPAAESR